VAVANAFLVKPLHRRRGFSSCNRLRRFDRRRRAHLGRRLLLRDGSGLRFMSNPRARGRPSCPPGMRNRGSCRVADKRAGHRANRSQYDGSRYGSQRRASRALLSVCFEREQRSCDHRRNESFLHRDFPEPSAAHGTAKMRRYKGVVAAATARFKRSTTDGRRGLNGCDADDVPVICPTCQIPLRLHSPPKTCADRVERGCGQRRRKEPAASVGVGLCDTGRTRPGRANREFP
jgi:hypothetical protein